MSARSIPAVVARGKTLRLGLSRRWFRSQWQVERKVAGSLSSDKERGRVVKQKTETVKPTQVYLRHERCRKLHTFRTATAKWWWHASCFEASGWLFDAYGLSLCRARWVKHAIVGDTTCGIRGMDREPNQRFSDLVWRYDTMVLYFDFSWTSRKK